MNESGMCNSRSPQNRPCRKSLLVDRYLFCLRLGNPQLRLTRTAGQTMRSASLQDCLVSACPKKMRRRRLMGCGAKSTGRPSQQRGGTVAFRRICATIPMVGYQMSRLRQRGKHWWKDRLYNRGTKSTNAWTHRHARKYTHARAQL